ncbi:ubiquitin C-terminal hydrolase 12-like [Diospyros lotus]|uniref:ubiquitin C-terminal hydrolase 12-like n=1 Tax=Diospyros lotus TaxID=55363 RepID=UPI0022594B13|nr:ubiquitin C-terminal hydrolase 12-like [Diospyros lotus]
MAAQIERSNTIENQQLGDPRTPIFTWRINNFSTLTERRLYSEFFIIGGHKWRLLIFPKGNNVKYFSMYLDVADSASLPSGWGIHAGFSLGVINQINVSNSVRKETQHLFNAKESDWGFTSLIHLDELYNPRKGYVVNDTCIVEAKVAIPNNVAKLTSDPKETDIVSLERQGVTGYINSILQILYHIPYFRKAIYSMPTTEYDIPSTSIPLALQSLFYNIQHSDRSVATEELSKSFAWEKDDTLMQHDVQELSRVLSGKLENKMKGPALQSTIQQLFEGHYVKYIESTNGAYKLTRKETFYDLELDVKGCHDVYASFDKYIELERLEDDNYQTRQYGLKDPKKGVLFTDFPPVLKLCLKRFEYGSTGETMMKINDYYEFPLQLDLDRENGKYLSPDANRRIRNLYMLHSVLVHSGGAHGGHYYAFIRPTLSDDWYKFDDEWVTKEDMRWALEEQYGVKQETNPGLNDTPNHSSAHILVYVRESDMEKIFCNVDEQDIPENIRERLRRHHEEKVLKNKKIAEAQRHTIVKVARDEDLVEQIGQHIYFDLVNHDKVRSFRVQKQMQFNHFKELVAKEFGIPVQFERFWLWAKRQNNTYRPFRPLTYLEETTPVGDLAILSEKGPNPELKLFLEVELGSNFQPIPPPRKIKDDILLFFKLYDPEKENLRYVGRLIVNVTGKPTEILSKVKAMAGLAPEEDVDFYEEIRFEPHVMCEPIDKNFTYQYNQLQDGDIVCFQKSLPVESADQFRYPNVHSFLEYVHDHQVAPKSISTQPISDADIEATYNQAGEVARSIASSSTSLLPLSSVDEATNQEVLQFFNLLEVPFEELATSRSSELLSCMTKIQTIAATVFTEDQQKQLNEMADQLQSKVDGVQLYHDEIKAKNDYIASLGGISSSILSNNGKDTELKQEDQQLATEEQELREKLERVIKQRLDIRRERETLYAETKDLLSRGKNGDAKIRAAKKELRQAQLKLKSLTDEWDFFKDQFF